jgi:hypothetical protein
MNTSTKQSWAPVLQLAGLGVALAVGIWAGQEVGDSALTRIMLAGPIAGALALFWFTVVWLLFQPDRDRHLSDLESQTMDRRDS